MLKHLHKELAGLQPAFGTVVVNHGKPVKLGAGAAAVSPSEEPDRAGEHDAAEEMVPKRELTAALSELGRLRRQLEGMTPTAELLAAQDAIAALKSSVARLEKLQLGTVPRAQLDSALDGISAKCSEMERLRDQLANMVPRSALEGANESLRVESLECERLTRMLENMVPKVQLQGAQDEIASLKQELDRSEKQLKSAQGEIASLAAELRGAISKSQFDSVAREVETAKQHLAIVKAKSTSDLDNLRSMISQMVPKSEMAKVQHDQRTTAAERDQKDDAIRALSAENERLSALLASGPKRADSADPRRGPAVRGPSLDRSQRPLSFAMPATGLAKGQDGRLAPFMVQVRARRPCRCRAERCTNTISPVQLQEAAEADIAQKGGAGRTPHSYTTLVTC